MSAGRPRLRKISFTTTLPRDCYDWILEECKREDPDFNPQSLRPRPTRKISEQLTRMIQAAMLRRPLLPRVSIPSSPPTPTPEIDPRPQCHGYMVDNGASFFCFICGREIQKARSWEYYKG